MRPKKSALGQEIATLLREQSMTAEALANAAGLNVTHLYRLMNGQTGTKAKTLHSLAVNLGIYPDTDEYREFFALGGFEEVRTGAGSAMARTKIGTWQHFVIDTDGTGSGNSAFASTPSIRSLKNKQTLTEQGVEQARAVLANLDRGIPNQHVESRVFIEAVEGAEQDILELMKCGIPESAIGIVVVERIWARRLQRLNVATMLDAIPTVPEGGGTVIAGWNEKKQEYTGGAALPTGLSRAEQ